MRQSVRITSFHALLLAVFGAVFVWSLIAPKDLFTWFLEVFPALIGVAVLAATFRTFPLSNLLYAMITVHACILFIGGHYTYAEMPLFTWLRDEFNLARNYYDRVGHFAQGFVPALIARELFIRRSVVPDRRWRLFLIVCVCMAVTVTYEFIEWGVAVWTGEAANDFLATQGDIWDTQWDMFICTVGALAALATMGRWHDRSMDRLREWREEDLRSRP